MTEHQTTPDNPCKPCDDAGFCVQDGACLDAAKPHRPRTTRRSKEQTDADSFDMDLYRLLCRAERFTEGTGYAVKRWEEIVRDLRVARARVRGLMSPADRIDTLPAQPETTLPRSPWKPHGPVQYSADVEKWGDRERAAYIMADLQTYGFSGSDNDPWVIEFLVRLLWAEIERLPA